jgi:hypothetical protein
MEHPTTPKVEGKTFDSKYGSQDLKTLRKVENIFLTKT